MLNKFYSERKKKWLRIRKDERFIAFAETALIDFSGVSANQHSVLLFQNVGFSPLRMNYHVQVRRVLLRTLTIVRERPQKVDTRIGIKAQRPKFKNQRGSLPSLNFHL